METGDWSSPLLLGIKIIFICRAPSMPLFAGRLMLPFLFSACVFTFFTLGLLFSLPLSFGQSSIVFYLFPSDLQCFSPSFFAYFPNRKLTREIAGTCDDDTLAGDQK